jgi:hypothetical protein
MQVDTKTVDDVMESCVAAGLAVRRADRAAARLREERDLRPLSAEENAELASREAEARRLSQAFFSHSAPCTRPAQRSSSSA